MLARHLREFGLLPYFDCFFTSVDVGFRKPHSLPFVTALDALGVRAWDAVMVGDSLGNDVLPAEELGMTAVLKYDTVLPPNLGDRIAIRRLSDLLRLLAGD